MKTRVVDPDPRGNKKDEEKSTYCIFFSFLTQNGKRKYKILIANCLPNSNFDF
jgi:hypothetical protein